MADGDANYSAEIARNLREILDSDRFVIECCTHRNLKISQALCLLWHNQDSGDVPGRKSSAPLFGNVTAAALIDLYVLGKIDFEDAPVTCLGIKYKNMVLKVIDFTPTNSYLDDCLFNQMVAHAHKHCNKPRGAEQWILKGSNYHKPTCVSATFDSLVRLGLLGKESRLLGTFVKYPTLNSEPQNKLVKEVKMIALEGHDTDGFTWTLLKLARFADSLSIGAPILRHLFSKEEYRDAKRKIKELVDTIKQGEKGKNRRAAKELEFDNLFEKETCS